MIRHLGLWGCALLLAACGGRNPVDTVVGVLNTSAGVLSGGTTEDAPSTTLAKDAFTPKPSPTVPMTTGSLPSTRSGLRNSPGV